MSIDMSQFHDVLFEECFECLDSMESGLMSLDLEHVDLELVNTIFRGAHTIKGGCATFGFHAAADYALSLEKHLNEMRNGTPQITQPIKDILLSSVDFLRGVVTDMQNKQDVNEPNLIKHKNGFEAELARFSQS
jgi:two-component system chemotaxis sensor kinase CheA